MLACQPLPCRDTRGQGASAPRRDGRFPPAPTSTTPHTPLTTHHPRVILYSAKFEKNSNRKRHVHRSNQGPRESTRAAFSVLVGEVMGEGRTGTESASGAVKNRPARRPAADGRVGGGGGRGWVCNLPAPPPPPLPHLTPKAKGRANGIPGTPPPPAMVDPPSQTLPPPHPPIRGVTPHCEGGRRPT